MRLMVRLKGILLAVLPDGFSEQLRRMRHRQVVARSSAADEPDLAVLPALLAPGSRAVDLGANIGVYTRHMSDLVGASGRVLSVEPIPTTFETLRSQRLNHDNVVWLNRAVSARPGTVRMTIPDYPEGGSNYYQSRVVEAGEAGDFLEVSAETVDALVAGHGRIDFIKCDVEGHELACIEGASRTLQDSKPAWLIEISGNPDESGSSAWQCIDRLTSAGYGCYWLKPDGRLHARRRGDTSVNYFFLAEPHLKRCREVGLLA